MESLTKDIVLDRIRNYPLDQFFATDIFNQLAYVERIIDPYKGGIFDTFDDYLEELALEGKIEITERHEGLPFMIRA